ncbi:MAG: ABC-type transport auxiliary lipoprotein family protein [Steroidobacteraceae bacterium]
MRRVLPAAALLGPITSLGMLLAAAGCSAGLHSDARAAQVYVLRITQQQADEAGHSSASLHVGRPLAGPGLDSDHIVLVQSDHRMSYYVASRWPADLPRVVEALAVQRLRASGGWSAVQDSSSAFPSDYILQIAIRRFEADYTAHPDAPEVHVVFDCTLGKRAGREVMTSFVADGTAVAAANRLGEVVSAFEGASNKALDTVAARASQAVRGDGEHRTAQRE